MTDLSTGAQAAAEPVPRTFGLKDVFTCINLLGGVLMVVFSFEGRPRYAGFAFLLGYFLGDALDGLVARLTHTGNAFGREFDVIADHMAQCVGPAVMVFTVYRHLPLPERMARLLGAHSSLIFAAALASILIIAGSIRHARASVASANFPMAYVGLPRTVSAFIIVSYLNSHLVQVLPGALWIGAVLLVALSILHLIPLPYRTHHGKKLALWVKFFVLAFFATTGGALLFYPAVVFDVSFFWLTGYVCGSWLTFSREDRQAFFDHARSWSDTVRRAK